MTFSASPSEALLVGRRALEELHFFELLDDWAWYPKAGKWGLRCRLQIDSPPDCIVASSTIWYILAAPKYPWGQIDFFPAKEGGLSLTFQHQDLNSIGDPGLPWRKGKICHQTSLRSFGRRGYDYEPMSADKRLAWHVVRALDWVAAAADNSLIEVGEPFEAPYFPVRSADRFAFIEGQESFRLWSTVNHRYGYASIMYHSSNSTLFFASSFKDCQDKEMIQSEYGSGIKGSCKSWCDALWVRLESPPILPPWQTPSNFGELRKALLDQGVDFKALITRMARPIRDGRRHFMLLGFPIPRRIGERLERLHWQAFLLPVLSSGNVSGFQRNEMGYQRRDEALVMRDNVAVDWLSSSNWHSDSTGARGHLPEAMTDARVLLIGAGALGSAVAQLLVRMGLKDLLILDGGLLEVGNLCRHTGQLADIGRFKAESVAAGLTASCPHACIRFINKEFSDCDVNELKLIQDRDTILDCTASDALLSDLSSHEWATETLFISLSVGLFARRLFYFAFRGKNFPHDIFARLVSSWINQELDEHRGLELPRDGVGCWHPVFPARADDIWLMIPVAVKAFEHDSTRLSEGGVFRVFEQYAKNGLICGIQMVQEVKCP